MYRKLIVPAIAVLGFVAQPSVAQELTGTLKKIKDSGAITIGHRESSVPFSYYDDNQKVIGYAMDLCYKIADAVKKIADRLGAQEITDFQNLFPSNADRNEVVVTFLAILELGRLQKVRVLQHMVYGTIYIVLREKLNSENVKALFESGDSYAYQRAPTPAV